MLLALKDIYRKEQFYPSLLGLVINPFYFARKEILTHVSDCSHFIKGRTLDLGCGTMPYKKFFTDNSYVGLEIDTPEKRAQAIANVFYNGEDFPFQDNEFDSLVSFQVLEHVQNAEKVFSEIKRVVKPGGTMLLTIPFLWEEHEPPYDFRRISSYGIRELARKNGWEILQFKKSGSGPRAIGQVTNAFIESYFREKMGDNKISKILIMLFGSLINLVTLPFGLIKHEALYLDNIVVLKNSK